MKAIRMALSERANILKAKWKELSKRTKRVFLGIGAVLSVILIIAGFIHFDVPRRIRLRHRTEQVIKEDVTRYLEERYGEKFIITNVIPPGFNYASYIITAYKVGAPQNLESEITIQGWNERGLITYYDNYPVVKLIPEYKEYVSDIVGDFFSEHKVHIRFSQEWYESNISVNITLKEFLRDTNEWTRNGRIRVIVFDKEIDNATFIERAEAIGKILQQKGIRGPNEFNLIFDENNYKSIPDETRLNGAIGEINKDYIRTYCYILDEERYDFRYFITGKEKYKSKIIEWINE